MIIETDVKKYNNKITNISAKINDDETRIKTSKDFSVNIETIEEKLKVLQGEIDQFKWEYKSDKKKAPMSDYLFMNSN